MINVTKKDSLEIIETPIFILNQKANYLKGKFCYYSENYAQALKFFNESRNISTISNAEIIRDSIGKIKKILQTVEKSIEYNVANLASLKIPVNTSNNSTNTQDKTKNQQTILHAQLTQYNEWQRAVERVSPIRLRRSSKIHNGQKRYLRYDLILPFNDL